MLNICVDTSNKELAFTLTKAGKEVLTESFNSSGKMNEFFFSSLDKFCTNAKINAADIKNWIVITGPGSFTGIRIGLGAVSGLVIGFKSNMFGLCALDAAAVLKSSEGIKKITIGARLKQNEFALKKYDFDNDFFSEIYVKQCDTQDFVMVNSGNISTPPLTKAICYNAEIFYKEPVPVYVRKSEAELNFDKKSCSR